MHSSRTHIREQSGHTCTNTNHTMDLKKQFIWNTCMFCVLRNSTNCHIHACVNVRLSACEYVCVTTTHLYDNVFVCAMHTMRTSGCVCACVCVRACAPLTQIHTHIICTHSYLRVHTCTLSLSLSHTHTHTHRSPATVTVPYTYCRTTFRKRKQYSPQTLCTINKSMLVLMF